MCHRPSEPSADRVLTVSVARRPTAWSCCGTAKSSSAVRNQPLGRPGDRRSPADSAPLPRDGRHRGARATTRAIRARGAVQQCGRDLQPKYPAPSPRALKIFLNRRQWPQPHYFLTGTPRPTPSSRRLDRNLIAHHWPARAATGCPSETPPEDGGVDGPVRVPSWWLSPLQQHNTTSLPPPRSSPGPCASGTPLRWPRSTRSMPSPSVGARVGFYPWPLSLNARPTMHPTTLGNPRIASYSCFSA